MLNSVSGGSLLSIGSLEKRKGLKKLAKNLGKCWNGNGMYSIIKIVIKYFKFSDLL